MNVPTGEALEFLAENTQIDAEMHRTLDGGLATRVYGPYMREMVRYGAKQVHNGNLGPEATVNALGTAALLYADADKSYAISPASLHGDELRAHQANVLSGKIELVPEKAATSERQSVMQVMSANELLTGQPSCDEAALAAINYGAFFRPQTMASGTRTLDRREIDELLATADSTQEAMPHLSVSNWAIGQTLAGIYRKVIEASLFDGIRGFDMGSGHGATPAAITNSLRNMDVDGVLPNLALTAIETTPEFYEQLVGFAKDDQATREIGLEVVVLDSLTKGESVSEYGALKVIKTDAAEMMRKLIISDDQSQKELVVVTANYSWHRLGRDKKGQIMDHLGDLPNVVFIIGDLAQNTSVVNRRYFNLGVNGPVNAGNRRLGEQFKSWGYSVVDLDKQKPADLDPRIASRLRKEHRDNDGHLWIAYKGQKAEDALDLVDAA